MTPIQGLSESEVAERHARGEGNDFELPSSQTLMQILRRNLFTFINIVLFSIGLVLIFMGEVGNAVATASIALMNVVVGVFQEARAKRTLDKIALLTRPKARAIREGEEKTIDPSEIVLGDALVAGVGDQIVVDGAVIDGQMDVDESLLTGESDLVSKRPGAPVYSGSFCVTGQAVYEVTKVGADSTASKLAAGARAFRMVKTPLQMDIDLVIRLLVFTATNLGILIVLSYGIQGVPAVESVRVAAVIVALVPQGLFFMITVTYAMGAVRIAGKGALIQQANAVESLSNVTVLCLDKTGTLTTNRLRMHAAAPLSVGEVELERALGDFVTSMASVNRTAEAILKAYKGTMYPVVDAVSFSSARKWSALCFDTDGRRGVYVLGAPEMLASHLAPDADLGDQTQTWAGQGLRVLLFAYRPEVVPLRDADEQPALPADLIPLGALSLSDELRSEARDTLRGFAEAGIGLKIISGDNPHTVAALARQAGLSDDIRVVSGLELDAMSEAEFEQTAVETTVFGRITPEQKERLVRALRAEGAYVAMIGDGVNDVLSLKQAHLGIAMQSGSQATRSVADIVLIEDSFAVLPTAFKEGQRIVNGMQDIVRLFLSRTFYLTCLIIATAILGMDFPVTPMHNTVLAFLTVGLPTLVLAAWARPGRPARGLLRSTVHFVIPAGFTVTVVGIAVYAFSLLWNGDVGVARTALTTTTVFCGLVLVPFVEPPTKAWVGGDELSGDRRPTYVALAMLAVYALLMLVEPLRDAFELTLLTVPDYVFVGLIVAVWALVLRFIWRERILDRFLGFDFDEPRERGHTK